MALPSFADFYFEAHGRPPFPWQIRLAEEVLQHGWNGLVLNLPTGVGKTTTLEIALYCLACQPERMPRRTVLVVDRRIVVDQAATDVKEMQKKLDQATSGALKVVADRLRSLSTGSARESCLAVAVLRGGMPRENDWARSPDLPVVGLSTVDQVGSRLLFRGYGVNPKSAPIHAGLLGNDTLILLDEVHLAKPFEETLSSIEMRYRRNSGPVPQRSAFVPMSATLRSAEGRRVFELDDQDRQSPVLRQRLEAHKLASLKAVKVSGEETEKRQELAKAAVTEALRLQKAGAKVVGIVVNRVETARQAARLLRDHHSASTDCLLVTGRMRPISREQITQDVLLPRCGGVRKRSPDESPLVVVATQCIEAGADLDLDGLVSECAALDALRQRFGRLDRRGELVTTSAVVLIRSDQSGAGKEDPVYGSSLAETWTWLQSVAEGSQVDFGIQWFPSVDAAQLATLSSPAKSAPILQSIHLDGWMQTSPCPTPDSNPALWLHGPSRPEADVQIIWRDIPELLEPTPKDQFIYPKLEALPPSNLEALSLPIGAAKSWLAGQAPTGLSDVVGSAAEDEPAAEALVYRWTGDESTSRWISTKALKPGDVLIVSSAQGGLDQESFAPESTDTVSDLSILAQWRARRVLALPFGEQGLNQWGFSDFPAKDEAETDRKYTGRLRSWATEWPKQRPEGFFADEAVWDDARKLFSASGRLVTVNDKPYVFWTRLSRSKTKVVYSELVTENEESLFPGRAISLKKHSLQVETLVRRFASNLSLPEALSKDLSLAARFHDLGKADPRFQLWLAGGDEVRHAMQDEPMAKSELPSASASQRESARRRAGYPKGYRHELLSVKMLEAGDLTQANDRDLILHLVASHHGWCRPFPPFADHPDDVSVDWQGWKGSTRHGLTRLDSGLADRFWTLVSRYGWWELAWLETILRLADHNASEQSGEGE